MSDTPIKAPNLQPTQNPPKRKRGAPTGNQNARTHGFYARRLPQSQLDGLENTTVRSLEDEIEVMRVFSRKVAELGAEVDDLDEAKSLLNTLANATGSINRLVRTHIPDRTLDPNWMLRQALLELQEEGRNLKGLPMTISPLKRSPNLMPRSPLTLPAKGSASSANMVIRTFPRPPPPLHRICNGIHATTVVGAIHESPLRDACESPPLRESNNYKNKTRRPCF